MSARKPKQYRFITAKPTRQYSVTDTESPHMYSLQCCSVEQKLNKKEELIDKYQSEIDQLLVNVRVSVIQLNSKEISQTMQPRALLNKRERVRSSAKA